MLRHMKRHISRFQDGPDVWRPLATSKHGCIHERYVQKCSPCVRRQHAPPNVPGRPNCAACLSGVSPWCSQGDAAGGGSARRRHGGLK